MSSTNDQFYARLPVHQIPLSNLLTSAKLFANIPADWHVIITDIIGSTKAVQTGRHEDINLMATGSIVTVMNIAYALHVTAPFFFGGDGATFIVPPSIIDKVMQALALYKESTMANFKLELRIGTVPVKEIYANGNELHIARFCAGKSFSIPVLLGNGLNYAEKLVKGNNYLLAPLPAQTEALDLTGMQCRWDRIPPPENKEEIVTLLVIAGQGVRQSEAFKKVIIKIDEFYGSPQKRQPISIPKLKLKTTFNKIGAEIRARMGKIKVFEFVKTWVLTFLGPLYFRTTHGKNYLENLVEMSDTLVIDGKINTVISGTAKQRIALQRALDVFEARGEIIYGLHVSKESVMSCYVRDMVDDHIHFVDGSEGGYTQAAMMLKAKL
ncbi:DUF3095 domain-containing protein [Mucilaginibacter glaciei]|uniref:DUF3095 domain-containing protein n=1 Tax=Mucilaginibacter glaciei TaxID=2772109 RepID=A0A926NKS3_9SPHI|nr:DUF3095 domain-containing protein [Mucilaginibacter glaciei]MBD1393051.1 DUF3095 domain-containing protein [Mucilaginibacter glaciei]